MKLNFETLWEKGPPLSPAGYGEQNWRAVHNAGSRDKPEKERVSVKMQKGVDIVDICDSISTVKVWTAKQIVVLRTASGMTQAQFANWLGVTRAHVSHIEAGIRPAGSQTVRLLGVLEKLRAGKWKPVQPPQRRKTT